MLRMGTQQTTEMFAIIHYLLPPVCLFIFLIVFFSLVCSRKNNNSIKKDRNACTDERKNRLVQKGRVYSKFKSKSVFPPHLPPKVAASKYLVFSFRKKKCICKHTHCLAI